MRDRITVQAPLYTFLSYCNDSELGKVVLDCGAGGATPPLALFHEQGYKTFGVDISAAQVRLARKFCQEHAVDLGIVRGDMRNLPFASGSMSFVYSIDSICHMTKNEVSRSVSEVVRVMREDGLCFISFLSVDDDRCGRGTRLGTGEFFSVERGEQMLHSFYEDTEPAPYFSTLTLIRREKRRIERFRSGRSHGWAAIDYIARKR
jgi:SAM-dependent methyltransferase